MRLAAWLRSDSLGNLERFRGPIAVRQTALWPVEIDGNGEAGGRDVHKTW